MSLARRRAEVAAAEAALADANQDSRKHLQAARARVEPFWPWLLIGGGALAGGLLAGRSTRTPATTPASSGSLMRRLSQLGLALRLADRLLAGAGGPAAGGPAREAAAAPAGRAPMPQSAQVEGSPGGSDASQH